MSNAIKFTPEGGSVTVGLACEPTHAGTRGHLRVTVKDTGLGVDPAMLPLLFKPFFQVAVGHSRMDGTGLGLAICKRIVDAMGGQIGVESEGAGRGSTFWFSVELKLAKPLPPPHIRLLRDGDFSSSGDLTPTQSPEAATTPVALPRVLAKSQSEHTNTDILRGRRMLLAEDNAVNAMLLKRQLKAVDVELVRRNGKL